MTSHTGSAPTMVARSWIHRAILLPAVSLVLCGLSLETARAFTLSSTSPTRYALGVPANVASITAVFDAPVALPPVAAVRVAGVMSGIHSGSLSVAGGTLTWTHLDAPFFPGEMVNVNFRNDIVSESSDTLTGGRYFAFTVASGAGPATWSPRVAYGAADIPYFIYGGDLDNDGDPDLAVPNEGSNAVSSFLNGNGSQSVGMGYFPTHAEYGVGQTPSSCFGEDFDNDGDQDVATADINSSTLSVLLNNGDGSFAPRDVYAAGNRCRQVYGGDFDGDNDVDLCTTSYNGDRVLLFYNAGDGTFAPGIEYADVQDGPFAIETGDFNGDGHLDIGVGCQNADSLTVLTNDGAGSFTTTGVFKVHDGPWDLAGNDMDGDGDFDLVAVASNGNKVVTLINDGTGAFPTRNPEPTGVFPLGVFTADLDGDADIDALASNFASGSVGVYLNDGSGTLTLSTLLATQQSGSYAWAHDLDADGDLDLSIVDELADSLFVFYNGSSPVGVGSPDDGTGGDVSGSGAGAPALLAWPNPARSGIGATIRLSGVAASGGALAVDVFAIDGRRVRRVTADRISAGSADAFWDGRDERGRAVAPGRYLVTTSPGTTRLTREIQLVR